MSLAKTEYLDPPVTVNSDGKERTVGYEFEFTGVEMEEAANLLASLYGGAVHKQSAYQYNVTDTELGTFKLEIDARLLRDKTYESKLRQIGIEFDSLKKKESIEETLMEIASSVVPFEIITPPIPLSSMHRLDELVNELRQKKAKGTGSSVLYAFGLHLNPEVPAGSPESILHHLQAYCLLDPWIREDAEIDISRSLTPYINEYKADYLKHIFSPDYNPSLDTLIRDYMTFGNSRNRPLDLLPLFMHLDEKLTQSMIDDKLTSARPTYHYRLPNCSIEDPEWKLASEWNRWVRVEEFAALPDELSRYCKAWLTLKRDTVVGFERKWIELMNRRLHAGD
ncbi:MAG: amidoligase family protein [Balneolaceae bacterium]